MQSAVLRASAIGLGRVARPVIRHLCVRPHGETRSTPFVTVSRVRTLVSRSATRGTAGHALLIYVAGANGCRLSHVASHRSVRGRRRARRVWTIRRLVATPASDPRRRALQRAAPHGRRSRTRPPADSPRERELVIGSLAERRQHKRQPAGRRSRWTEREHLPMASPCRTRPREPEARARCGLSGSHARPSRARLAVGSSVVHPARALVAERTSTVCATPALAPRRRARQSRRRAWRERMSEPDCDDNVLPAAALTV